MGADNWILLVGLVFSLVSNSVAFVGLYVKFRVSIENRLTSLEQQVHHLDRRKD